MSARRRVGIGVAVAAFGAAGIAGAGGGHRVEGGGRGDTASLSCPGGMTRLGQVLSSNSSVFEGDPVPMVDHVATIDPDGYQLELIQFGTHTGTHIDAPAHFVSGARTIDELEAREFVWPAYVIDVRQRVADVNAPDDFQLSIADIKAYEKANGKIKQGSMVIIYTGWDIKFGTPAYSDPAPGFAADAVQWLVDQRKIGGIGSDTFGPDASSDEGFSATSTILANDRVAMPGIAKVGSLNVNGDIIIASAVALMAGSGFETDPLACHGRPNKRSGRDD
jgi:kynurenine formamidase